MRTKVRLKADIISDILARKNKSQNWLALRLDTSSGYLSQLMAGVRNPSPIMREKILSILGEYTFDDVFALVPDKTDVKKRICTSNIKKQDV